MIMSSTTNMLYNYLQNVCKNYALIDSLLEIQKNLYNIQKPLWSFIHFAPFTTTSGRDKVVGTSIYSDWTQVIQFPQNSEQMSRFNTRLSRLCFALKKDIVNHRDIQLVFFFNRDRCQSIMNVYSNNLHTTVNFLSNNIHNLLSMEENLNVRNAKQYLSISLLLI